MSTLVSRENSTNMSNGWIFGKMYFLEGEFKDIFRQELSSEILLSRLLHYTGIMYLPPIKIKPFVIFNLHIGYSGIPI